MSLSISRMVTHSQLNVVVNRTSCRSFCGMAHARSKRASAITRSPGTTAASGRSFVTIPKITPITGPDSSSPMPQPVGFWRRCVEAWAQVAFVLKVFVA